MIRCDKGHTSRQMVSAECDECAVEKAVASARRAAFEECAEIAENAGPKAHTYASENADVYRAYDDARDEIAVAIRARLREIEEANDGTK